MQPVYVSFERAEQKIAGRDHVDIGDSWHICNELVLANRNINPQEVDAMDFLFVAIRKAGISEPPE